MESDFETLSKSYFPILDKPCINYLYNMISSYSDSYSELKSAMIAYLKCAFPKSPESEINNYFESVCDLCSIDKTAEPIIDDDMNLESIICIKDIKIGNKPLRTLASAQPLERGNLINKKRLVIENKKIQEKNEKRQILDPSSQINRTAPELSVSQQLDKRFVKSKNIDIKIENFNLCFGSRSLVSNANLTITNGRIYGLMGRNGYGKTTLLNAISNRALSIPPSISIYHVKQEVVGDDTTVLNSVLSSDMRHDLHEETNSLQKQLENSNISESEKARISQLLEKNYEKLSQMDSESMTPRASSILSGLGFPTHAHSLPTKTFSGGWRMRISLAQALFMKPDLLLLDEPTNMLDLKSLFWLKSFLPAWKGTVIIVSHDRHFLDAVCTDIIHLTGQQLYSYRGDYSTFERTHRDMALRQKREYDSQQAHRKHVQAFIDRFSAGTRASLASSRVKALEKLPDLKPPEEEPEVVLKFFDIEDVNKSLIQLDNVSFKYSDDADILSGCCVNISPKSRLAIVGDNGSGKTTLLKIINGDLEPTSGNRLPYSKLKTAYLAQHHLDQLPMEKCSLEIMAKTFPGKTEFEYRSHLGSFGLTADLPLRPILTLSGGQKTRVSLALIAFARPNLFILDEPTNHLDIETVDALITSLKSFKGAVIVVSHNEYLLRTLCHDFYECKNKKLKHLKGGIDQYISKISENLSNKLLSE